MKYFITAIGTDSGKTLVSAIFCKALNLPYWKPIQAGEPRDSDTIKGWCPEVNIHREGYLLKTPESPHAAARKEDITVTVEDIVAKVPANNLIIEGAGGLLVPVNDDELMIDLIKQLGIEVILVCNLYLGSINHSLLSIEALQNRNIPIKGIVFNGESNPESEQIILNRANVPCLLRIKQEKSVNEDVIADYAKELVEGMNA